MESSEAWQKGGTFLSRSRGMRKWCPITGRAPLGVPRGGRAHLGMTAGGWGGRSGGIQKTGAWLRFTRIVATWPTGGVGETQMLSHTNLSNLLILRSFSNLL